MRGLRLIYASAWSAALAITLVVILTIGGELFTTLKGFLKALSGHHWISKSLLMALVYLIGTGLIYLIVPQVDPKRLRRSLDYLIWISIIAVGAVFLFFLWHYLGWV